MHGKSKLIRTRFGSTGILTDIKMLYFANRRGKSAAIWSCQKSANDKTDKSDMRERSKAELWECIIAKAEEGYNEQRRLKSEVKAERIQNFGGLGFFLAVALLLWWVFAHVLIFIDMKTNHYYK